MKKVFACILVFTLLFVGAGFAFAADEGKIIVVDIHGEIEPSQLAMLTKALDLAKEQNAAAVVINLDTFGGLVDTATAMRDKIIESETKTIIFVKNRAWSAGALIALANKNIAITSSGSIGAAEPIPATEKIISALKAEFAATAEKHNRNPRIAEAMVDKTLGFEPYAKAGQILSLTGSQAVEVGFADVVLEDFSAVVKHYELEKHEVITVEKTFRERFIGFVETPAIKSFLFAIIMLAIITEVKTAGTGVAAMVGILAAVVFFGNQFLLGLGNWLPIILFVGGLALLIVEIFVPGFGIFGVAGIIAIFASFIVALGSSLVAIKWLTASIFLVAILFMIMIKFLPKTNLWKTLILKEDNQPKASNFANYEKLIGEKGVALTTLRPAGIIEVKGKRFDALTNGDFIEQNDRIIINHVEGNKIYVTNKLL